MPLDEVSIAKILASQFTIPELRTLLLERGVHHEDVSAQPDSRESFAWSIVGYFQRRGRLVELGDAIDAKRPTVNGTPSPAAPEETTKTPLPKEVFISYCSADRKWLTKLQPHLDIFERQGRLHCWDDTDIKPGQDAPQERQAARLRASAAILLVSADYLNSQFIMQRELPALLHAIAHNGLRIYPLIVRSCAYAQVPELSRYQPVNSPDKPLAIMLPADAEQVFVALAELVSCTGARSSG